MSIKPLPRDVVAQIKSSVAITSLNNVICGLVKNALDAEATKINLTVDYSRGNCSIEDNGVGIPPSEFKDTGGLGQLHYTSKHPPHPDVHGKHGVFLASVASLSLFTITSHHRDYHSHNSMSIHNSRVLTRHTPCLPEQRLLTFNHGTRATARDLFGSMPVRVKHRALQAEKLSFSRDWDQLILDLVALLIAWPSAVSLSIRESSTRQNLVLRTASVSWLVDSCRLLHQASLCDSPGTSDWVSIGASSPALSVSGYVCREPVATKRVQFIAFGIELLSNEFRSNVLYEEVNRVFADSSFGAIEDEGDSEKDTKEVKMDNFVRRELKTRKGVDRWPMFFLKVSPASETATQRPLGVDDILDDRQPNLGLITDLLKAMFYQFLKNNLCRPRKVVLSAKSRSRRHRDENKSSGEVDAVFANTVITRPGSDKSSRLTQAEEAARNTPRLGSPESRSPDSRSESPFAAWSRIKSGHTLPTFKESAQPPSRVQSTSWTSTCRNRNATPVLGNTKPSRPVTTEPALPPLYDANGKLTRKPFEDIDPKAISSTTQQAETTDPSTPQSYQSWQQPLQRTPEDETFEWINPVTQMVSVINSRTGFALPPKPLTLDRRAADEARQACRTDGNSGGGKEEKTPWLGDLVNKWKNPVFELTERPIPKLPDVPDILGADPGPAGHKCNHSLPALNVGSHHETTAMGLQVRLSKDALENAVLIAQVDRKFILAKVPFDKVAGDGKDPRSSFLVLIDQHAADERCRVEGLMKDYFEPTVGNEGKNMWKAVSELLPNPVQFEVSSQDKSVLHRFQKYFSHWGICYDVEPSVSGEGAVDKTRYKKMGRTKAKVIVRSLPPAITERCRSEPRLLAELVRREAWRLHDETGLAQQPRPRAVTAEEGEKDGPAWVSLFHGCPQGIVELINSRSCRSAVMFNDPLTLDQCTNLLDRLVRCVFPFQCAHGRPSMVPLVDLGDGMVEIGSALDGIERNETEVPFGRRFKEWKQLRSA
ncbi:hypothetical protein VMCG_07524 [Cytospora schulzeri]|uniref:MutL C-terminal dimerisation domain-containing protein n=1 Tax=Cytospora schulzeri TaxID=448051 RepID=A0A423W1B4_9PEZI|nr:hypothetical protein VMCG_07524 [Valsa malicola]